jgi:hypothetical protein
MSVKRVFLLSSLFSTILFAQDARATLLFMLPDSSYAEKEGNWQGYREHTEDGFYMRVDFTVYDTRNLLADSDEETLVNSLTGEEDLGLDGQYIYAYQIFNKIDPSYKSIEYFGLLDSRGNPINGAHVLGIGSFSDAEYTSAMFGEGIEPTESVLDPLSWTFGSSAELWDSSGGCIDNGDHSWFLVFSSNTAPVSGSYKVKPPSEFPVPEPGMLTLVGIGGVILVKRRRRAFKQFSE